MVTYEALRLALLESARVRVLCPILVLLAALSAPADVIHLKNGRTIWADQVREDKNKDRVEYDVGEDTYAIPKSSIDRIDAGGAAPVTAQSREYGAFQTYATRAHLQPRKAT